MTSARLSPAKTRKLLTLLAGSYPEVTCALEHRSAYELLAATILSAQCTDARVNQTTPKLFATYPTPKDLSVANQSDVEELIRSTGFFRNKAKNIIGMAKKVVEKHGGEIPQKMEALVALPGVARKTANVLLGTWFKVATGVVVDTHVTRITRLLGLTQEKDPVKIERDLMQAVPKEQWVDFAHRIIHHGRQVCVARRPACDQCSLAKICPSAFGVPPWV